MRLFLCNRLWVFVALLLLLMLGGAEDSVAQTIASDDNQLNTGFSCSGGSANGQLFNQQGCSGSPEDGKVFSYFICQFEEILNEILSEVYCAVVGDAGFAVKAALTLLVAITGVAFLMGLTPFTAKELMMLAAKFSLVLAFALEAEYMIGVGYNLFISMTKEGIVIVLDHLFASRNFTSGDQVYDLFDQTLQDFISAVSQGETQENTNRCEGAVFGMLAALAVAVPPLAIVGMYFVVKLLWMVLRAVFGYCQGLLGLTFLVVLAPIYVSFSLFKPTRTLFDKWVQYLISFSFQMVVVFAFLGMVFYILDQVSEETSDYRELVRPQQQVVGQGPGSYAPIDACGICKISPTSPKDAPECESDEVLPFTEVAQDENFLQFASVKVLAMVILFYVLDIMLDFVPEMAKHLAGPKYAGQLGGGRGGNMQLPFEQAIGSTLSKSAQSFAGSSNSATGLVAGLTSGVTHTLMGDRGLVDTMIRSVANPLEPHRNLGEGGDADFSPASNLFAAAFGLTAAGGVLSRMTDGALGAGPSGAGAGGATTPRATGGTGGGGGDAAGSGSGGDSPGGPSAAETERERLDRRYQHHEQMLYHNLRNSSEEVDLSVAVSILQALKFVSEDAGTDEVQRALSSAGLTASRAQILRAVDQISLYITNYDHIEEIRGFANRQA